MNDDITSRELELVANIRNALHKHWTDLVSLNHKDGRRVSGFVDAVAIVYGVLADRGFDIVGYTAPRLEE